MQAVTGRILGRLQAHDPEGWSLAGLTAKLQKSVDWWDTSVRSGSAVYGL